LFSDQICSRMNDRSARLRPAWASAQAAVLPPQVDADGPRRKILEAALRLFATQGFHGSSIREIVKLVELQASAVYAHFPSKESVLAELARLGHQAHFHALQSALLDAGADPVDQLAAIVGANAIVHATYPHLAVVVNEEMRALSDELAAPALALRNQSTALALQILDRGLRAGRFSTPGLDVTVAAIGAMAMRIPYWYSPALGYGVEQLADKQVELALRMVGARR
jgi:AcrR family transcriptional regulator